MKRILAAGIFLALSTSVFADGYRWRSPVTPAPTATPASKYDLDNQYRAVHHTGLAMATNHGYERATVRRSELKR